MAFGETPYGDCNGCGEHGPIAYKKGWLCSRCNSIRLQEKRKKKGKGKPLNPISDKGKEVLKKDEETYEKLWESRPHFCEECGTHLGDRLRDDDGRIVGKHRFSHILPKGAYPELRWVLENFNLLCYGCHDKWEDASKRKDMKIFEKNAGRIAKLKGLSKDRAYDHLQPNVPE